MLSRWISNWCQKLRKQLKRLTLLTTRLEVERCFRCYKEIYLITFEHPFYKTGNNVANNSLTIVHVSDKIYVDSVYKQREQSMWPLLLKKYFIKICKICKKKGVFMLKKIPDCVQFHWKWTFRWTLHWRFQNLEVQLFPGICFRKWFVFKSFDT